MKKSQLVIVPSPGISHLMSTVEFAKLLVNHHPRLSVTILIIQLPSDARLVAYTHSLASSPSFPTRLHLTLLPTRLPSSSSFLENLIEIHKPDVREALSKLHSDGLVGFVVDMFCTPMIDIAHEFGIPSFVFFTSGAAVLGFVLHIHDLIERRLIDPTASGFEDSKTAVAVPTFVNPVPPTVFPTSVLEKDSVSFFLNYARGLKKAKGFIVNTFEELESHAVHALSNTGVAVYPVGPILSLNAHSNQQASDSDILEWLDHQPPSSVLFLCFGSDGCFERVDQVKEIARALENSGVRFLWSLRKPPPKGSMVMKPPSDYSQSDLVEILPEGFLDRTAGNGRIIGWCPQTQILAHKAIGGFVSHCGWNSTLESVYFGVPIATWPLGAEQQMNAFQLVCELKMAVEISLNYRKQFTESEKEILSAERIEKGIKQVMQKDTEVRTKVKEMSEKSRKAFVEGGSSYSYLSRFIDDIMNVL